LHIVSEVLCVLSHQLHVADHLCTLCTDVVNDSESQNQGCCPELRQMLTDFQNSFTVGLSSKCVMKWSLKIPQHLKRVGTLPCETQMSENWRQSETNVLFNHKFW